MKQASETLQIHTEGVHVIYEIRLFDCKCGEDKRRLIYTQEHVVTAAEKPNCPLKADVLISERNDFKDAERNRILQRENHPNRSYSRDVAVLAQNT